MRSLARHHRIALALAVVALAVAAVATLALAARRSNGPAARAESRRLLGLVALPAGMSRLPGRPSLPGGRLSFPPGIPVVPGLVDLPAFFSGPGTPAGVIAWVSAHRPHGASQGGSGGDGSGDAWTSFEFGRVPKVLALRDLVIEALGVSSGRVVVRVDAQAAPLPVLPGDGSGPGAVRVVESGGMLPPVGFSLRCDPAGGTVPHAARVCAAIRRDPALLYSFPGPDHSCPFGLSAVSLAGTWDHRRLHSTFSECTGGQEQQAAEWASLLPSGAAQATVHVDRGIGLIRLGAAERAALDLLRGPRPAPAWCASCIRTFDAGSDVGYGSAPPVPVAWTVRFTDGRVSAVSGNAGLTVAGRYAPGWFRALSRALRGWRTVHCGAIRELVHASAAGSTALVWTSFFQRVVVSGAPLGCPAVP